MLHDNIQNITMELSMIKNLISFAYKGSKDKSGKPHGYGEMEYKNKSLYEGSFSHGKRNGYGIFYALDKVKNPVEKWECYQIGDYDAAGRLVHPENPSGSYEPYVERLCQKYAGWWKDDQPIQISSYSAEISEIDISNEEKMLDFFLDYREIVKLSPETVELFSKNDSPICKYAYGQWLYRTHIDKKSLKTATECFKFASENGIADALAMLSVMYFKGEYYDKYKDSLVLDRTVSHALNAEAIQRGSKLAKLIRNHELFFGREHLPADENAAIAEAEIEVNVPGTSLLWREQLGWFYDIQENYDKAIEEYEKCIEGGLLYPIYDLALIYLNRKNTEHYYSLMKDGISRNVSNCMTLGFEKESEWDNLNNDERYKIHEQLQKNLKTGIKMGNSTCAFLLAYYYTYEKMGFEWELKKGLKLAFIGAELHNKDCCKLMADIMNVRDFYEYLPEKMRLSEKNILMMELRSLRYGNNDLLDKVINNKDVYISMGLKDEIESVWQPRWDKHYEDPFEYDTEDYFNDDYDDDGKYDAWV